jgi:hypothetical protein
MVTECMGQLWGENWVWGVNTDCRNVRDRYGLIILFVFESKLTVSFGHLWGEFSI